MPKFAVRYRVGDNIYESGTAGAIPDVETETRRGVFDAVRAVGGTVLQIEEIKEEGASAFWEKFLHLDLSFRFGASASEWAMLCDILGALMRTGVPVLNAVRLASAEGANSWLAKRMGEVADAIEAGMKLSDAMESVRKAHFYPFSLLAAFPFNLVSAVRAGEESGEVPTSLDKMAVLFRRRAEIKRETLNALIYPAMCILTFIVVCAVLVTVIPPALTEVVGEEALESKMSTFPTVIQWLFKLKKHPEYALVPLAVVLAWNLILFIGRRLQATKIYIGRYIDRKVPIIGKMRAEFALVDFLESISLNEKSGIKLTESLGLISRTSTDPCIQEAVASIRNRIVDTGESFALAIGHQKIFPGLVRQMISAAGEGGNLSEMVDPLADYYNLTARATLKRMIDFMTPAMIIVLGSVIGPVVVGIYKVLMLMTIEVGNMS